MTRYLDELAPCLVAIALGLGIASLFSTVARADDTNVSLALNYTLGTEHGGIVAAERLGYFRQAGLKVTLLPWSAQTRSETLVSLGRTDLAMVASTDDALVSMAADRPIVALAAFCQADPGEIGVKADSNIKRPADLDGKTYGGFGSAKEPLIVKALIMGDGGKGDFHNVTIGTAAYKAVYAGRVDAALFFTYSEAVEAQMYGRNTRYFRFTDYGLPDQYSSILIVNRKYLAANTDAVRKLVRALVRGYEYQSEHPADVANMLTAAGSAADPMFLNHSINEFNKTLKARGEPIGHMSLEVWQARANFWIAGGFLVDGNGAKLTRSPALGNYVTNSYLPQ
jgi:ABC-type nitrate/sulfonate/bicarbonate transport system substrate-binding protein